MTRTIPLPAASPPAALFPLGSCPTRFIRGLPQSRRASLEHGCDDEQVTGPAIPLRPPLGPIERMGVCRQFPADLAGEDAHLQGNRRLVHPLRRPEHLELDPLPGSVQPGHRHRADDLSAGVRDHVLHDRKNRLALARERRGCIPAGHDRDQARERRARGLEPRPCRNRWNPGTRSIVSLFARLGGCEDPTTVREAQLFPEAGFSAGDNCKSRSQGQTRSEIVE